MGYIGSDPTVNQFEIKKSYQLLWSRQAGAELCQAQYKLELAKFWFRSVASLKGADMTFWPQTG